ncbi:MAG: hypothetical protein U0796_04570 [Gemmatales bacterium]
MSSIRYLAAIGLALCLGAFAEAGEKDASGVHAAKVQPSAPRGGHTGQAKGWVGAGVEWCIKPAFQTTRPAPGIGSWTSWVEVRSAPRIAAKKR